MSEYRDKIILLLICIILMSILIGCTQNREWRNAVLDEDIELIKKLISEGQDVDAMVKFPLLTDAKITATALAYSNNIEICKLLIENGADVNIIITDYMNYTPIMFANCDEKVELLIDNGADVNATDEYGNTVLGLARDNEKVKLLIENGANINQTDKYNRTALIDSYISKEKAEILIDNGIDIHIIDTFRDNALSKVFGAYAHNLKSENLESANERLEVIELLVNKGAILVDDVYGENILDKARELNNVDSKLISLLERANNKSVTPSTNRSSLEILDGWTWEKDGNYTYIRGSVKNNSNSNIRYFKITAQYYDKNNNVVDTSYTNSGETIRPGNSKRFEIMHRYNGDEKKVGVFVDEVRFQ